MSFSSVALGLYIQVPKERKRKKGHLAGAQGGTSKSRRLKISCLVRRFFTSRKSAAVVVIHDAHITHVISIRN